MDGMPDAVIHNERTVSRHLVATFGPQMRERGKGHIVNISSVAGLERFSVVFHVKWMQSIYVIIICI